MILRILLVLGAVLLGPAAYAACSNPDGDEGVMIYNEDFNVMQFCNGTDWVSMAGTNVSGAWALNGTNLYYNGGSVGVGNTTPNALFDVRDSVDNSAATGFINAAQMRIQNSNNTNGNFSVLRIAGRDNDGYNIGTIVNSNNNTDFFIAQQHTDDAGVQAIRFLIENNGNICGTDSAFEACSSDERLKQDITPYTAAGLKEAVALQPVTFEWNDVGVTEYGYDPTERRNGFVAQEVQEVMPAWVSTDEKGYMKVDDGNLRFVLLRAVQELKAENDALRTRIEALEARQNISE